MRQVTAGDQEAFRQLIDKYRNYLYKVAYSVVSHPKDAEDAAQEAWVQIYVSLHSYEFQGFKTWMTRIVVNKAIDLRRKRQAKSYAAPAPLPDNGENWSSGLDETAVPFFDREKRRRIFERLDELPNHYRDVVVAFYFEDLSYLEISNKLGIAEKTVQSQLYRARNWIRKHWKEDDFR